jgi:hypothetical protein
MGERIGRIGRIQTDFLDTDARVLSTKIKKKIRLYPPDPPNPFSHCITFSKAAITTFTPNFTKK